MTSPTRRKYLERCAEVGVGVSIGIAAIPGTVKGDNAILSGKLISASGDPIAGRSVYFAGEGYFDTDSDGRFEADVDPNSSYSAALYKSGSGFLAAERNGVPHVYRLGSYTSNDGEKDLGEIQVPKAYLVRMQALDEEGDPVKDATPGVRHGGFGVGSSFLETDEDGWAKIKSASFDGIELRGETKLSMEIPTGSGSMKYTTSVNVEDSMTVIFQVGEGVTVTESDDSKSPTPEPTPTDTPTETTESMKTAESTPAATETPPTTRITTESPSPEPDPEQSRGFFTNNPETEPFEFLNNPYFLTVSGFVLSITGITVQLLRGH